jgi:hypothetical protein
MFAVRVGVLLAVFHNGAGKGFPLLADVSYRINTSKFEVFVTVHLKHDVK